MLSLFRFISSVLPPAPWFLFLFSFFYFLFYLIWFLSWSPENPWKTPSHDTLRYAHCQLQTGAPQVGKRAGGAISRGSQLGMFPRWDGLGTSFKSPVHTSLGAAPHWLSALLPSLEDSPALSPSHFAWHEWSFPTPGIASRSPRRSAALTNTVFHCLPPLRPHPRVPCLSCMASDRAWFPSLLRA